MITHTNISINVRDSVRRLQKKVQSQKHSGVATKKNQEDQNHYFFRDRFSTMKQSKDRFKRVKEDSKYLTAEFT